MDFITFIISWFTALIAMTTFSALWSKLAKCQFREPILLSQIITKTNQSVTRFNLLWGWAVHIILGALFLSLYELLWSVTGFVRTLGWALVFGSVLGILGIMGWTIMFKLFAKPTHLNASHFFVHLFLAHLVFSLVALWIYLLTS